jgi:hypothetical protein
MDTYFPKLNFSAKDITKEQKIGSESSSNLKSLVIGRNVVIRDLKIDQFQPFVRNSVKILFSKAEI